MFGSTEFIEKVIILRATNKKNAPDERVFQLWTKRLLFASNRTVANIITVEHAIP